MHSRIYTGWVEHRRTAPHDNRFRYRLFMMYLDLDELPRLFNGTPFWSARRPALAHFKRSDYLGPAHLPLDAAVRDLVERRTGVRPSGPIRLLTHLRYFGYCMNPVSFYYCFNAAGDSLQTIVAEITNTPWGERHQYVLPVRGDERLKSFEFEKNFHVSPFLPMDMHYRWSFNKPAQRLFVNMRNFSGKQPIFDATLSLHEKPVSRMALLTALASYPFMTLTVLLGIYFQALKLYLKHTPLFDHPRNHPTETVSK
jgi:uncharacterized protein